MSASWIADQLARIGDRAPMALQVPRYNPRPRGVIREGSATEVVLAFLRKHRQHFFKRHQIVAATGRSGKAVDWALIFLRSQGLVECASDDGRNLRYLRYRAVQNGQSEPVARTLEGVSIEQQRM